MFSRFIVSEEDIARQQVEEDLQLYGSRPRPPDAVDNGESIQLQSRIPKQNASVFEATVDRPAKLSKSEHCITFNDGAVTAMDWNSGASPLDAWLNQSAIPSTATVIELPDQHDSVDDLVAQESEEIKVFRNVHLATASSPEQKETAVDGFEGLELAAQFYYRNIRDRYPLLPTYLARRLAQANYQRSKRYRSWNLKPEQPDWQVAVQPHSVSDPFSHTGGPANIPRPPLPLPLPPPRHFHDFFAGRDPGWKWGNNPSMIQIASDVPADKPVVGNLTYETMDLGGQVAVGVQDASEGRKLEFPSPFPESSSSDFWTGRTPRESPVSSINSSLHGRPTFDPEEQNPTFLMISPSLPPPPVELDKVSTFDCNICGQKVQVAMGLKWQ